MTDTSGGEPTIADVLTAINGLRVNGPEPVRALPEDILALGNRTQRLTPIFTKRIGPQSGVRRPGQTGRGAAPSAAVIMIDHICDRLGPASW